MKRFCNALKQERIIAYLVAHVATRVKDKHTKAVILAFGFCGNHDSI